MKTIQLTQGKEAIVSDEWYEILNAFKWNYHSGGYAKRMMTLPDGRRCNVFMHRVIAQTPEGMDTDHINGNKLDNRVENLRVCSRAENKHNIGLISTNKSGYKGVSFNSHAGKWMAQILVNGEHRYLGLYTDPIEAAKAYNLAAVELQGEFARVNL